MEVRRVQSEDQTGRQYDVLFFYENFRVALGRPWENATNHAAEDLPEERWGTVSDDLRPRYVGAELNPNGLELDIPPYGSITLDEKREKGR